RGEARVLREAVPAGAGGPARRAGSDLRLPRLAGVQLHHLGGGRRHRWFADHLTVPGKPGCGGRARLRRVAVVGVGGGRRARVTMTDVARHAGVSTMTVSNVINGRSQRVSESTRQRVLATIAELGYQVNETARNLRRGRTGAVGLAVPACAPGYSGGLADRLADRFAAHGLRLAVERTGASRTAELDALTAPRLSGYDGFVLSVVAGDAADLDRISIDTPVVLIGERAVPARFDHVLMDNVGGARLATALLLRTGARRIALLGGVAVAEETMPGLRTRGYRAAHAEAGIPVPEDLIVSCDFGVQDGY